MGKTRSQSKNRAQLGYESALVMQEVTLTERHRALEELSSLLESESCALQDRNEEDLLRARRAKLAAPLMSRLVLDNPKIFGLREGIRDLLQMQDPLHRVLRRTELDDGLILEQKTVPLGLVAVVFESRPDVVPQILSLILKSGNAVILKGGKEAERTNRTFEDLVEKLNARCPFLPPHWAQFVHTRQDFVALLRETQYVSLVIPRGSNALVQSIMRETTIPVLGHADGVCHIYVHPSADFDQAIPLIVESKVQSPSACNAVETLLIDEGVPGPWLLAVLNELASQGVELYGCSKTRSLFRGAGKAVRFKMGTVKDWHCEYSSKALSIKIVSGVIEAIHHINTFGSHHTDVILAEDRSVAEMFQRRVDSACVFLNCSTRFSDGFRFGLGAEVGISTSKLHARGPVGIEGLTTTKWEMKGKSHCISPYLGEKGQRFKHRNLLE